MVRYPGRDVNDQLIINYFSWLLVIIHFFLIHGYVSITKNAQKK